MDPVILRSIERIVAVLIGGLSIYLGFRLFLAIPERTESAGKVVLPGGISIYLTRIGPGAFFALFGSIVVATSFHQAISYHENSQSARTQKIVVAQDVRSEPSQAAESAAASRSYTGFGGTAAGRDLLLLRIQTARDIQFLNTALRQNLRTDLSPQRRADIDTAIPRLKLALLWSVWDPAWGDFARFKEWLDNGSLGPAPNQIAERFYVRGEL